METPETQGVPIAHRCWDCGYDLRGLVDVEACPECGADRGEQIERRRALFVRLSAPSVVLAGFGTVLCCVTLGLLFGSARTITDSTLGLALAALPVLNLLIGSMFLARCDRALRPAVASILVRAAVWANVPFSLGAAGILLSRMFMIALPIAGVITLMCCLLFIVRWSMLADRAYLPVRGRLGGVQAATVVTIFITGMWPVWFVVISRLLP